MCVYRDVSPTSQIRVEVGMESGYSVWAKHREADEAIDLDGLFSDYWSSDDREFTVLSKSYLQRDRTDLIEKDRGCCHWKI